MVKLAFLANEEQQKLIQYMEQKQVRSGEHLFVPGDKVDGIYFIVDGRLGVFAKTGFEEKMQVVALLDPGAVVGEKALTIRGNGERGMTITAIEDTQLLFLSMEIFTSLEKNAPELAMSLVKSLLCASSRRLQSTSDRLAHVL